MKYIHSSGSRGVGALPPSKLIEGNNQRTHKLAQHMIITIV
jgi:hypothetical protein